MSCAARGRSATLPSCSRGCSWFTDFKRQPKIDPWQSAADTIPSAAIRRTRCRSTARVAPGFIYGRGHLPASIDSMSSDSRIPFRRTRARWPTATSTSQINCAVCHGYAGAGDGVGDQVRHGAHAAHVRSAPSRSADGYIFGMIRNGRGVMPTYNRIEEPDRWDIVNYIRAAAGQVPGRDRGRRDPSASRVRPAPRCRASRRWDRRVPRRTITRSDRRR